MHARKVLLCGQFDVSFASGRGKKRDAAEIALINVCIIGRRPAQFARAAVCLNNLRALKGLRRLRGAQGGSVNRMHHAAFVDLLDGVYHACAGDAASGVLRKLNGHLQRFS